MTGRFVDAHAIAELLGVPVTWVRESARSGAIPHRRFGRYVRFDQDEVLAWTSLTNGAAAGKQPIALMARAGHSSMATTKGYLHLAGVVFRDEADALERRLLTSAY
jgi:excisionase family DNA binding protein